MPSYEITIGAETTTVVQPGQDNAGQRKAAFISASNTLGLARQHGVHGIAVPDADDANATAITVPRGAGDAGAWDERATPRLRPSQAPGQASAPAESGIVARPDAEKRGAA